MQEESILSPQGHENFSPNDWFAHLYRSQKHDLSVIFGKVDTLQTTIDEHTIN